MGIVEDGGGYASEDPGVVQDFVGGEINSNIDALPDTVPQKYRIGEEEYDEKTLREALEDRKNKSQWQKSYSERDMTLAEERKAVQKARQVEDFLNKYPDAYQEIEGIFKKRTGVVETQADPRYSQLEQKLSGIEEKFAVKEATAEIDSELKGLREKYPEDFKNNPNLENEVVKFAVDNGIMNIKVAYKAFMFEPIQARAKDEGMVAGKKAAANSRGLAAPSGSRAGAKGVNIKGTWADTAAEMIEKYGKD
jgi:hypothetical protein